MVEKQHPYDGIADSLFEWMQGEVDYHIAAMRGGYRDPFSAPTTEREKLDYFRRQMYKTKPDGTVQYDQPNPEGRDKILKQYGTQTYAQVMEMVKPKQGARPPLEPEPDADPMQAQIPPMPEDEEPVETMEPV